MNIEEIADSRTRELNSLAHQVLAQVRRCQVLDAAVRKDQALGKLDTGTVFDAYGGWLEFWEKVEAYQELRKKLDKEDGSQ